ncbi:hypothetical protein GYMLUDRAFT_45106, partial [Collybiopsis luxurians FD-317 M1]
LSQTLGTSPFTTQTLAGYGIDICSTGISSRASVDTELSLSILNRYALLPAA